MNGRGPRGVGVGHGVAEPMPAPAPCLWTTGNPSMGTSPTMDLPCT